MTKISLMIRLPPATMLAIARATPVPATMPGSFMPSTPRTPWNVKGTSMIEEQAEQARIEDRLEGICLRIAEFARVANGGLEAIRRPCGDEHGAENERPSDVSPDPRRYGPATFIGVEVRPLIWPVRWDDADDQHRDDHRETDPLLSVGGAENAAMLDGERDEHQSAPMKKVEVEVQRSEGPVSATA